LVGVEMKLWTMGSRIAFSAGREGTALCSALMVSQLELIR